MKYLIPFLASTAIAAPFTPSSSLFEKRQNTCATPSTVPTVSTTKLPDPFTFADGKKVTTKADWACRQRELSFLIQKQELGEIPATANGTGTVSSSSISVKVTDGGKSISFSASVKLPSSGQAPYPAIIAYGGSSLPIPGTVATITFNNDNMAAQQNTGSRGKGIFYDLYGSGHSAGAMAAWAWGVSRIMDVIEADGGKIIDPKRVGVTGCSRNGKGAFIAGAFEPRIALTLPQESGSGGAACWRISDSQKSAGKNIQTASEIVGENAWFGSAFNAFSKSTNTLATDHHELASLVAPRGLFVIENDIDWLGPVATTGCMKVARMIFKAVGAQDSMGFSLVGGHSHCQFPSAQQTDLTAFINKYLLGQSGNTDVEKSSATADPASYIDWTPPTLT